MTNTTNTADLRASLTEARDWFESQAKAVSKGCGSSYELHDLRVQRDALDAALAAPAQPVAWPRNAAEVREFMDAHCQREERANDDSSPSDDDLYALTADNFLSAVNSWAAEQPAQEGEYPKFPESPMFDAVYCQGNPVSHGYSASQVRAIIDADRAARAVYSRSMDLVRVFWQQHTQAYALSMTMAELHNDVELVIRAARGAAQAAPVDATKLPSPARNQYKDTP